MKKILKEFSFVIISNFIKLLSSLMLALLLPISFSLSEYGFFRLFILYSSYTGLLHLGFIDGIYLKYGSFDYESLPIFKFRIYTRFLILTQIIIMGIVILLGLVFISSEKQLIFILVGINIFATNLTSYFQYISQITRRFKEFAFRNTLYSFFTIAIVTYIYFNNISSYRFLIIVLVFVNYILLLWYMITYRNIIFGKGKGIKNIKRDIISIYSLGSVLLISNVLILLINNLPKQLVEHYYSIEVFAIFSFAIGLMGIINLFVTALSVVLFPTLMRLEKNHLRKFYFETNAVLQFIVAIALVSFIPITIIVGHYLPKYILSLDILLIIYPSIIFTSKTKIITHNYFKTFNLNKIFLLS